MIISADAPMRDRDLVIPAANAPTGAAADAPMTRDGDAQMIPHTNAPATPDDAAPSSGWHIGYLLGSWIPLF